MLDSLAEPPGTSSSPGICCSLATKVGVSLGHVLRSLPQHPGNKHSPQ